jgi:hypothetical protein
MTEIKNSFRDKLTQIASRIIINHLETSGEVNRIRKIYAIDRMATSQMDIAIHEYIAIKSMRDI